MMWYSTTYMDCLFCKIANGEIPSQKIYEDDYSFAFLDIKPVNPGHVLVIPKEHAQDMFEMSSESWGHVMKVVHKLAPAVLAATNADGINLVMNNRREAGQEVDHAHMHIIPRHADDGKPRHLLPQTESTEEERTPIQANILKHL